MTALTVETKDCGAPCPRNGAPQSLSRHPSPGQQFLHEQVSAGPAGAAGVEVRIATNLKAGQVASAPGQVVGPFFEEKRVPGFPAASEADYRDDPRDYPDRENAEGDDDE